MAQQHTSSDAISENITALVATVASHHSGLSTTLTTVAENVAITRQQIEFQNAQHAKDKELLSGVIKDLTNASQIADKEKEQLWEQARGSKDALSKALGDEAAARQRAAIADEEVAAVKQKLRDMTTEHSQVVAALKQQMVREREDSEEVLKTFKAKSQRLSEELEAVKEQLSQAHVDNQIMARKLEKVEEDAKAAIETAQTTAAAMSEEARLARAEADQLRKESVFVTSQLTETHAKLAATESELKTTAKDKHVLAHVMRDVEARHKQAVDKVEAEKDAILQQKHGVMRELEDARAIIQAKKKLTVQLCEQMKELQKRAAELRQENRLVRTWFEQSVVSVTRQVGEAKSGLARLEQRNSDLQKQLAEIKEWYEKSRTDAKTASQSFAAEREVLVRVLRDHQADRLKWEEEKTSLSQSLTMSLSQVTMMQTEKALLQGQEIDQNKILTDSLSQLQSCLVEERTQIKTLRANLAEAKETVVRAESQRQELWNQMKSDKDTMNKLIQHLESRVAELTKKLETPTDV
eukprot:c16557_g1_i1.p2 GENE.c16557_g1_i1~~c16557_g1_i1.p2  ORF type:complete len:524 (-),score=129.72 c16557_g1_i1:42-1613(-)